MTISSLSGDITALAVRLTNLRAGVGTEAAGAVASRQAAKEAERSSPGYGPAVVLDERTARLADAAAAASAGGGASSSSTRPLSAARREMIAAAAESVEWWQRQIRDIGETLGIYAKTGRVVQIQTTFSEGNHKWSAEMDEQALKPWGGAENFIAENRERLERTINIFLPTAENVYAGMLNGN